MENSSLGTLKAEFRGWRCPSLNINHIRPRTRNFDSMGSMSLRLCRGGSERIQEQARGIKPTTFQVS